MLIGLHHVQLAMPKGGEDDARAFYGGILRLYEQAKPEPIAAKGGCWFEAGTVRVHLGIETPFAPAKKAHPAFLIASLEVMRDRLDDAGVAYEAGDDYPGIRRIYVSDPFGNRLELLERVG